MVLPGRENRDDFRRVLGNSYWKGPRKISRGLLVGSDKFFRSPEEEPANGDMEPVQEGPKESRISERDLRCLALRLQGRGVDIDNLTLGEIIFMENTAFERDQTNWACSAQNEKLLPKRKDTKKSKKAASEAIKARVSPIFEKYYATYGRPGKNNGKKSTTNKTSTTPSETATKTSPEN